MMKKISNVSTTLIVNLYECFHYDDNDTTNCQNSISKKYNSEKLLTISRKVSESINTEILHESSHNFQPFGDSGSLLIQADLTLYNSANIHLKESHITFHTYIEDIYDKFIIVRLEYHISSCSEANVYNSLEKIISLDDRSHSLPDLISIDYLRRGAKYGNNSNELIYDSYSPDFNYFSMYDVSSNVSTVNTCQHMLVLDSDIMFKKFQSNNESLSRESIINLKNFLLSSYSDLTVDLSPSEIEFSK